MSEVKRAGDVKGTPDWQLDSMREYEYEKAWEEQNKEDRYTEKLREASTDIDMAMRDLRNCMTWLVAAAKGIEGHPVEHKLYSVIDGIEDIIVDLRLLKDQCEGRDKA